MATCITPLVVDTLNSHCETPKIPATSLTVWPWARRTAKHQVLQHQSSLPHRRRDMTNAGDIEDSSKWCCLTYCSFTKSLNWQHIQLSRSWFHLRTCVSALRDFSLLIYPIRTRISNWFSALWHATNHHTDKRRKLLYEYCSQASYWLVTRHTFYDTLVDSSKGLILRIRVSETRPCFAPNYKWTAFNIPYDMAKWAETGAIG